MFYLRNFVLLLLTTVLLFNTASAQENFVNSIGMKFKTIPAGDFYMGFCKLSEKQREFLDKFGITCPNGVTNQILEVLIKPLPEVLEKRQQQVFITKSFQIATHEVTVEQFMRYAAMRADLLSDSFIKHNSFSNKSAVSWVSWQDAQDFITWLNQKEGGNRYRLPTDAEWEYAARAGTTSSFSWGENISQAGNYAWYIKNSYNLDNNYAHPVGLKSPNAWGLYDMHGNVWEWVQDWFNVDFKRINPIIDPQGPKIGALRLLRGGGWMSARQYLQSATRAAIAPFERASSVGFRLVRTLENE